MVPHVHSGCVPVSTFSPVLAGDGHFRITQLERYPLLTLCPHLPTAPSLSPVWSRPHADGHGLAWTRGWGPFPGLAAMGATCALCFSLFLVSGTSLRSLRSWHR